MYDGALVISPFKIRNKFFAIHIIMISYFHIFQTGDARAPRCSGDSDWRLVTVP